MNLVEYLFTRLAQLGVRSVHGVPGDYNLTLLDFVESTGLHWVGNANELNAGYAADGYARIKGIAALVTSFGVGELSTINAIAGAYSERAPVVHIVGAAPLSAQNSRACLHHSLGDGNLRVFADVYTSFTVAQANLIDVATAPGLIDRTLRRCLLESRPVYIEVPTDMVNAQVQPPTELINLLPPGNSQIVHNQAVDKLLAKLEQAKRPLILVDGFAARFGAQEEINELIRSTGIPALTTPFGKSLIDETLPNFHGVFAGSAGDKAHLEWVQSRDLVLHFGPLGSDVNTFGFTASPDSKVTVVIEKFTVNMQNLSDAAPMYHGIHIGRFLEDLIRRVRQANLPAPEPFPPNPEHPRNILKSLSFSHNDSRVTQYHFWPQMSNFFRTGDVLMTETGTSSYGGQAFFLPKGTALINSSIWLSIGYMLAASQGVSLAQRELREEGGLQQGRTILFEGEGSLQMSAQAISDIIRNKLDIIIFVINNNGYTIERLIHGFSASYNDIQPWRNLEAPSYFGASLDSEDYPIRTRKVETWGHLEAIFNDEELKEGKGLNMIEIVMEMDDAPLSLAKFAEYLRKRNGGKLESCERSLL